jgi:hypothetical protein
LPMVRRTTLSCVPLVLLDTTLELHNLLIVVLVQQDTFALK